MADNEIRNPAKAYFKWKMPVITKSEDDWNFWNTEDKYNRTMFIGYNDTITPHVASLFIIVDGKPMQAVGDDVIARIAGLETNTAQALADIQALIDCTNAQQLDIDALKQECYRVLNSAKDAITDAQTWAEGTDEDVADLGGEHSAKGWAQKASDIVAAGLPSDATFDHITVTGSSKFGQDPDRANQPGLEIEGTGEIQAYCTVNMMNGATVSYDETVEMPWSDSSNKVPNTAWVQQAVMHGVIDPNTELTVKKISTTGGGAWLYGERIDSSGGKSLAYLTVHKPTSETDSAYITLHVNSDDFGYGANFEVGEGTITMGSSRFIYFDNGNKIADEEALRIGQTNSHAYATKRYIYSELVGRLVNGLQIGLVGNDKEDGVPFKVLRSDTTTIGKWTAAFGVTPTVPNITDAADASDKVPNTKWVQAAIAAGGGGSGAVTSVNGKTGEVVLAAADVGAAPADALANYVTTDAMNTELTNFATTASVDTKLADYQPKLIAGDGIAISESNVISVTGGTGGGAVSSVNGKTGTVVLNGQDIKVDDTEGASTVKAAIAAKQDAITAGTDLNVRSVKAHSTVVQGETTTQYTMDVTGNGFELKDSVNNISFAYLTPTRLTAPALVANGAPGEDTVFTCNGPAKIDALSGLGDQWSTGAFNWDINTTTDYNKFEVYNLYFTDDAETGQKVPHRSVLFSIGGSPTDHSTWVDFTANYLSFKGDTNFGEQGMNHNMNFNGISRFNGGAGFYDTVVLGHGEVTNEGEGGEPTTTPASTVYVDGNLAAYGDVLFSNGFSSYGSVSIMGNTTFWKMDAEGSITPWASYDKSTGVFNIDYLTSTDGGTSANRVTIMADSREANYGATFNLPVTVSDASFKRTSTLAADDNSTEVPTTAWVKSAIAASGSSVPDNITCKTLKVTNWDGELDSIEFAGNLKYSGDSGNGSLGKITANELFTNSSGYYGTRIRASGITLIHGSGSTTWFNADSSSQTLTINGTLKANTPGANVDNTEVATTAWVNTAITNKAGLKPTLTYAEKAGEPTVTKIEQCNGGSLCTIMWMGQVNTATGSVYIDLPAAFATAKIVSTQFTAHDTSTAAPWTADASITGGKITLSVKSTAVSSRASATIVLYKA